MFLGFSSRVLTMGVAWCGLEQLVFCPEGFDLLGSLRRGPFHELVLRQSFDSQGLGS